MGIGMCSHEPIVCFFDDFGKILPSFPFIFVFFGTFSFYRNGTSNQLAEMPINRGRACSLTAQSNPEMLLSRVLGCPNGKTIHSSKLFFEDSFDELKVVSWKSIPQNENYREALCLLGFSIIK
jgi:hypothetical protein